MTLPALSGGMTLATLRDRLLRLGYAEVDEATLDAVAQRSPRLIVLPLDNPAQRPEFADLLVILPEILRQRGLDGFFDVAFASPPASAALVRRFGVSRHPALVLLRHGVPAGVVNGLQDWHSYMQALAQWRDAPPPGSDAATATEAAP